MKSIRLMAAALFFAALFVAAPAAFAQTAGATTASGARVAVVDTSAFADDKAGITRFNSALKTLDTEFAPRREELRRLTEQFNGLVKDLDAASKSTAPIDPKTLDAKRDQAENLQKDIKRKQEDAQLAYQKRQEVVLGPIYNDIGKAIADYAKQKGYALIFDLSKDQNQMLVWANMDQADITADFIKFYNARPAGTATTAAPR